MNRNDRSIETKKIDEYEIKKIILNDGTVLDVDKITHVGLIKESRKGNDINFKITYYCPLNDELITLSNECMMLSYVFKLMSQIGVSFEVGCNMYDDMIHEARKQRK